MFWRKKKKEPDTKRRFGSLAFYFSIPTATVLTLLVTLQIVYFFQHHSVDVSRIVIFCHSFLAGVLVASTLLSERIKTLMHELKHAAVVVLTGNRVKEISVGSGSGHVHYEAYKNRGHLEPFVAMAPYFFPLMSLPILISSFFIDPFYPTAALYCLGVFYGIDLTTGFLEITSYQSDLKRIYGGYIATRAFILSVTLLYLSIVLFWALSGRQGILVALELLSKAAEASGGQFK
jgi:hypothetical protein